MRKWIWLAAVMAAPVAIIVAFYSFVGHASSSEVARRNLSRQQSNAVKHAYAAAEVYDGARTLGMGRRRAAYVADRLGHINEWVERYAKAWKNVDPTPEVYKDLRNNTVGIAAAAWLRERFGWASPAMRLSLIGWLSAKGELAVLMTDARIPSLPWGFEPGLAIKRFASDREAVIEATIKVLEAHRDEIERALQLAAPASHPKPAPLQPHHRQIERRQEA